MVEGVRRFARFKFEGPRCSVRRPKIKPTPTTSERQRPKGSCTVPSPPPPQGSYRCRPTHGFQRPPTAQPLICIRTPSIHLQGPGVFWRTTPWPTSCPTTTTTTTTTPTTPKPPTHPSPLDQQRPNNWTPGSNPFILKVYRDLNLHSTFIKN